MAAPKDCLPQGPLGVVLGIDTGIGSRSHRLDRNRARLGGSQLFADGVLEFLAEGNLDGLFVSGAGVEGADVELASHGVVVGAVAAQEGLYGTHNVQDEGVGVPGGGRGSPHRVVVGAVAAQEPFGAGGSGKGNLGTGQVVVGPPVHVVVGGNKGLGEDGLLLPGGIAGTHPLQDDGRVHGGDLVGGGRDPLVAPRLLAVDVEADGAGLGGTEVPRCTPGRPDLVAEADLELGGGILPAEPGAVVGHGRHQERVRAHGVVVGAVAAQKPDGGFDLEDTGGSGSSHGVVVGAVAAQETVGSLEIHGVASSHVVTGFPVDVVVGGNEGLSDELHVFGGGFTNGSLEDDLAVEDLAVVGVDAIGKGGTEGGASGRCERERKDGEAELHGVGLDRIGLDSFNLLLEAEAGIVVVCAFQRNAFWNCENKKKHSCRWNEFQSFQIVIVVAML
ncbi:unnamed protein product [Pseudo-nitzschia multistriata]|uniref:Uncharacterized protein n=1 Tax=Pseudo-nitzschia multistriata TaxID=183589 RepID=A0A448ZLH4_9STRA|nr:unnamed protein product [Pseudo-nitzschia multistriata]